MNPRVAYGVWIEGVGWLKRERARPEEKPADITFASESKAVAESAAELWGQGATVRPIDGSLIDLEGLFVERRRPKPWRLTAWWERLKAVWPTTTA